MSFVPRVLIRHPPLITRRSYSFLSNRHGRSWFNSSKAAAAKQQRQRPADPAVAQDSVDAEGVGLGVEGLKEAKVAEPKTGSPSQTPEAPLTPALSISSALTWPSPSLPPADHPQPSFPALSLERFWAMERPLLSLLPTNAPSAPTETEVDPEAEADAARLLARALVMNKLGAEADWDAVVRKLEGREEPERQRVSLDSVKRKRRKKMTKHKLKKRRRLRRAERRRLGK